MNKEQIEEIEKFGDLAELANHPFWREILGNLDFPDVWQFLLSNEYDGFFDMEW